MVRTFNLAHFGNHIELLHFFTLEFTAIIYSSEADWTDRTFDLIRSLQIPSSKYLDLGMRWFLVLQYR